MRSCQLYLVDPLTHSVPYLTKGARSLLEDLGEGFQYILRREGYRPHRIIVTSLLRTEADVTSLRRVNGNAARNSSHLYATTFDLSYTRFNRLSTEGKPVSNAEMARILAILIDESSAEILRKGRRCASPFLYIFSPGRADYRCYTVGRFIFYV